MKKHRLKRIITFILLVAFTLTDVGSTLLMSVYNANSMVTFAATGTSDTTRIHVKTSDDSQPYIYAWTNSNGSSTPVLGGWPGTKLNSKDDNGYYYVDINTTGDYNAIVNGGSGRWQTSDISGLNGDVWLNVNSSNAQYTIESGYDDDDDNDNDDDNDDDNNDDNNDDDNNNDDNNDDNNNDDNNDDTTIIHVRTKDGSVPYVYAWSNSNGSSTPVLGGWPGTALGNKDDKGYYSVSVENVNDYNMIVNGGSGKWQSDDINNLNGSVWITVDPSDRSYVIDDQGNDDDDDDDNNDDDNNDDNDDSIAGIYVKTSDGSMPYVYAWTYDGVSHPVFGGWPGAALSKKTKDGYYYVTMDTNEEYSMIINGGAGKWQTADVYNLHGKTYLTVDVNTLEVSIVESAYDTLIRAIDSVKNMSGHDYTSDSYAQVAAGIAVANSLIAKGKDAITKEEAQAVSRDIETAKNALVLATPTVNSLSSVKMIKGSAPYSSTVKVVVGNRTYTTKADDYTGLYSITIDSLKNGDVMYISALRDDKTSGTLTYNAKLKDFNLSFYKKTLTIEAGNNYYKVDCDLNGADDNDVELVWESSDESVVEIWSGSTIKAKKKGTAVVTAKTSDGKYSAQCYVNVIDDSDIKKSGDYEYVINKHDTSTVNLLRYTGSATEINIPGYIDGKRVTKLGMDVESGKTVDHWYRDCINSKFRFITRIDAGEGYYSPWKFDDEYHTVSITMPSTIEEVGDYCFWDERKLESVNLNNCTNLVSLGKGAFKDCGLLKGIDLSNCNRIKYINEYTFEECKDMLEVILPESLKGIDEYSFERCEQLKTINFEDLINLKFIASAALYRCDSLKDINLSNSKELESISGMTSEALETVKLPVSIREISRGTFSDCENLKTVNFEDLINLEKIGPHAFENNRMLESVNLSNCNKMTTIENYSFHNCERIENVDIPNSITYICSYSFADCYRLNNVNFDELHNLEYVEGDAFYNCAFKSIDLSKCIKLRDYSNLFRNCSSLERVKLPSHIETLSGFDGCESLSYVNFDQLTNIKKISSRAFENCKSLKNIDFSIFEKLIEIGDDAFDNCTSIEVVELPENIENICKGAFENCTSIEEIKLPDNIISIGDRAFKNCISIEEVILPESIKKIGSNAFQNCASISRLKLSESLTSIGAGAFSNINITELNLTKNLSNAIKGQSGVFSYNTSLKTVTLEEGIEAIEDLQFKFCVNLSTIRLPQSVKRIGTQAFAFNMSLSSINLPESVDEIGSDAFYADFLLTNINIPSKVTCIDCFGECYGLTSITGGCGVKYFAPFGRDKLANDAKILYWGNDSIISTCLNEKCSIIKTMYDNQSKEYADNLIIKGFNNVETIGEYAFYKIKNPLVAYAIPNTLKVIEKYAYANTGIKELICNDGLKRIGEGAFENSTLETVELNNGLTKVGRYAFLRTNIKDIVFPYSVSEIPNLCVGHSDELNRVTIMNPACKISDSAIYYENHRITIVGTLLSTAHVYALKEIWNYKFEMLNTKKCNNFEFIIIDNEAIITGYNGEEEILNIPCEIDGYKVRSLNDNIFEGNIKNNDKIKEVIIEDGITQIGDTCFFELKELISITIPTSVTSIGNRIVDETQNNCVIKCYRKSLAFSYAIKNRVAFKLFDANTEDYEVRMDLNGNLVIERYNGDAIDLEIPKTIYGLRVVGIDSGAFKDNSSIKNVYMDDNILSLGNSAFENCTNLEKLRISDKVTVIPAAMLKECVNLKSIKIPVMATIIEEEAFLGDISLYSVKLSGVISKISDRAFSGCSSLKDVDYPSSLKVIGCYAFEGTAIQSVNLPYGFERLDEGAYYNCPLLETVILPETIKYICYDYHSYGSKGIEKYLELSRNRRVNYKPDATNFGMPNNRRNVTIYLTPKGKENICFTAYLGSYMTEVVEYKSNYTESGYKFVMVPDEFLWHINDYCGPSEITISRVVSDKDELVVPKEIGGIKVTEIDENAFQTNKNVKIIRIPSGVRYIGDECFKNCDLLEEVWIGYDEYNNSYNKRNTVILGENLFEGCDNIKKIGFNNKVISVGDGFLSGHNNVTVYSKECNNFNKLNLPNLVMLGEKEYVCNDFKYLILDDFTAYITEYLGNNSHVVIPKKLDSFIVSTVGDLSFYKKTGVKSVTIPEGIRCIGNYAFCASGIESLYIPYSVEFIGAGVVRECMDLTEIKVHVGNENYQSVDGVLFTKDMNEIMAYPAAKADDYYVIPTGVTKLCPYVFAGNKNLEVLVYPEDMYYKDTSTTYNAQNEIEEYLSPLQPYVYEVKSISSDQISISWIPSIYAQGYIVYRKPVNGTWEEIAVIDGVENITYVDENLMVGKKYTYTVSSFIKDKKGNIIKIGDHDEQGKSSVPLPQIPQLDKVVFIEDENKKRFSWNKVDKIEGYVIYRKVLGDKEWELISIIEDVDTLMYEEQKDGKDYYYSVASYIHDSFGNLVIGKFDSFGINGFEK